MEGYPYPGWGYPILGLPCPTKRNLGTETGVSRRKDLGPETGSTWWAYKLKTLPSRTFRNAGGRDIRLSPCCSFFFQTARVRCATTVELSTWTHVPAHALTCTVEIPAKHVRLFTSFSISYVNLETDLDTELATITSSWDKSFKLIISNEFERLNVTNNL